MPEPYHIVDVTAAGPKELLIEAPVPHLIVYAAGEDRSRLLHSLTASTEIRARGTARLAHLSTRMYALMYGEDGNRAVIVVGDDKVHRAYSRGTDQSATAIRTARGCIETLEPHTPMFHATLAAALQCLEIINADGSAGDTLQHLSSASWMNITAKTASPQTLVAGFATLGWLQQGVNPTVDMRRMFSPRCAFGVQTGRYCYEGGIMRTADGFFCYHESKCLLIRLDVKVQAHNFASRARLTVASSQHGFDLLHPAAATSAEAQALAALWPAQPTRTVNLSAVPSWYTTERAHVETTDHLDEAGKLSALRVLDDALAAWRTSFENPTAFWRSDATCETFFQVCDSSHLALESPWLRVECLSLKSIGLDAPRACTDAKLRLLSINSPKPSHRSRARATARHLLSLFRGTNLWLVHVLAFMLWERGGVFPVDAAGRVRLPPRTRREHRQSTTRATTRREARGSA